MESIVCTAIELLFGMLAGLLSVVLLLSPLDGGGYGVPRVLET